MFQKRRKHKRESVIKACRVESSSGKWSCDGRVLNVSEGGIGLDIEMVTYPKDQVVVYMTGDDGKELIRTGLVAWFISKTPPEEGATIGLKFL